MEKFALFISQKVMDREWLPIHISKGGPGISHLFFADDILLFCMAKISQIRMLTDTLNKFCEASGLMGNFEKSRALGSHEVSRRRKENFTNISSIRFGRMKKMAFQPIMENIQQRLASWKGKLLNKAGRVCLARSVISSLPIYTMQCLWLPSTACKEIDRMTRNFIWSNNGKDHSFSLLN
ncbi:RNA-directed DNA polymerase [Bertholletia excelsa]